ncbi:MAG: hypothetical protein HYX38_11690 [Rhodospirillales bacterium]|nr:hypothetical protein [Rhodospirillales bacterium]
MTAFLCTESEILDAAALAAYVPPVREALIAAAAVRRSSWLRSPALAALEPQRAKAYRVLRQYLVEGPS